VDWFRSKGCQIQISADSVDTTGFYDEIGFEMGKNLENYNALLSGIRWAYREKRPGCSINLSKKSKQEIQTILEFSQKLYDTTLIARRFHDIKENSLQLSIQTAKNVQNFFNGGWLEWYALMSLLDLCKQRKRAVSCTRNATITFSDNEKFELDVFALIDSTPVCIECKIGEFRPYIERAQISRKRLGFIDNNFIMCIAGQDTETLGGLSAMHKLVFVNEMTLLRCLEDILERRHRPAE
jgi:Holliday junction resolvase